MFTGRRRLQDTLLYICKCLGLFWLARILTQGGVRILCYHGLATADEVQFRPGLFIRPATFERRLKTLISQGYPVMSLNAALDALASDRAANALTVITVDDVFQTFCSHGVPLLRRFNLPATAYLTTYYCSKGTPVFRLVVRYMFWRTTRPSLDLGAVDSSLVGVVDLRESEARSRAESSVIAVGEGKNSEDARVSLSRLLGRLLEVDYERLASARTFNIVTTDEARALARNGVDLQLHTHRHRLPAVEECVRHEIEDNRRVLQTLAAGPFEHLCYPSGIWSPVVWPWLNSMGVVSAATCDAGLNYHGTPRLGLKRILDAEDVSQIQFEAEMAGLKELVRRLREALRGIGTPARGRA
jgi:peptidoglycan/xylan/chitin deacetylase (PgdA/CDA1 family)